MDSRKPTTDVLRFGGPDPKAVLLRLSVYAARIDPQRVTDVYRSITFSARDGRRRIAPNRTSSSGGHRAATNHARPLCEDCCSEAAPISTASNDVQTKSGCRSSGSLRRIATSFVVESIVITRPGANSHVGTSNVFMGTRGNALLSGR